MEQRKADGRKNMKQIILAPRATGKSHFLCKHPWVQDDGSTRFKYKDMEMICGEWLSTKNNIMYGHERGFVSTCFPPSHRLHKSWSNLYKEGLKSFHEDTEISSNSAFFYNCESHIPYLIKEYPETQIKIVLPLRSAHRGRWLEKHRKDDLLKERLIDIVENNTENHCIFTKDLNWPYIRYERETYRILGQNYGIPIYESFEEALDDELPDKTINFDFDAFFAPYKESGHARNLSRYRFYSYIIPKLIKRNKKLCIVETGTMSGNHHSDPYYGDIAGPGGFTVIMADLIKNWTGGKLYTVDISAKNIKACRKITEPFSDVIEYVNSDSVDFLRDFERIKNDKNIDIDLLILDSYDLCTPNPHPSSSHHLRELGAIYDSISEKTIIAVDDNFGPNTFVYYNWLNKDGSIRRTEKVETKNTTIGKGAYVDLFLTANKWKRHAEFDEPHQQNLYCYEYE